MQKRGKLKSKKGSALLLAIILLFVVLSMVVSLTYVTVMEQKISSKTKSSVRAFFNAESGVEWALNKITSSSGNISSVFGTSNPGNGIDCPDFGSGSHCKVYLLDFKGEVITTDQHITNVKAIRAVGIQDNETTRAIETAVAQGVQGGVYTRWGSSECVGSDSKIYSGKAVFPAGASGLGGLVCYDTNAGSIGFLNDSGQIWSDGVKGSGTGVSIVPCAVCAR